MSRRAHFEAGRDEEPWHVEPWMPYDPLKHAPERGPHDFPPGGSGAFHNIHFIKADGREVHRDEFFREWR